MERYPFHTAYTHAREFYGLELNPDEFETIGIVGWDKIGNKVYKLYLYTIEPSKDSNETYYVDLPCNVDQIEAVTANYEDYTRTSNKFLAANLQDGWIEGYIESRQYNTGHLYSHGKFIKYRQEGNRLILSDKFNLVHILYKGYVVDDDGLPFITWKEVEAIAAFCAYVNDFKKARLTRDQATFQMSQAMEMKWKQLCTQARIPDYLNQNEMDEILNVSTSWDRKRFGKSFKPIK